jgi:phosphoenolpyruvate-protein phosphotransferase
MRVLRGIPASIGYAVGPSFLFQPAKIEVTARKVKDIEEEWQRLESTLAAARVQLESIYQKAKQETGSTEADIFQAHILFLEDPELLSTVREIMQRTHNCIENAWMEAIESNVIKLEALEDEYFRARAADLRDVGHRVLRLLTGQEEDDLSLMVEPSIIIAQNLTPSDTVRLDKSMVLGFCTAEGGPTSHTAILAKALNLPAIVGMGKELLELASGTLLLLDGDHGELIANPDPDSLQSFHERQKVADEAAAKELLRAHEPVETLDGHSVEIVANAGSLETAQSALEYGAEGIGLLRTEFLCLERNSPPNEEEQLKAYNEILDCMEERPVVIRTFDIGGDKELAFINFGEEANPFLGWRAIRMCLDMPEFFKTQLRALLRASPGHDLRIMFPMVATLEEVRNARALLAEARSEVIDHGHLIADSVQIGIMIEVPSAAILADVLAKEVDFFSIGTNDLTQYTFAAERTNEKVTHLGDPCHPAILRLIKQTIEAAHENGIWVGLCGEMAGDSIAIPILLGLGLDEFSVASVSIPHTKAVLRKWSTDKARQLAEKALHLAGANEVRKLVLNTEPG